MGSIKEVVSSLGQRVVDTSKQLLGVWWGPSHPSSGALPQPPSQAVPTWQTPAYLRRRTSGDRVRHAIL